MNISYPKSDNDIKTSIETKRSEPSHGKKLNIDEVIWSI